MPRTFSVEHAKSGRSKCKCCGEKISNGVIRMGTHQEGSDDYPSQTKWFHLKCFTKKVRKGPVTKKGIANLMQLSKKDRKRVVKYVLGDGDDASSSESQSESDAPPTKHKKKSRKRKLDESSDSEDEPPRKKAKISASDVSGMNVKSLKEACKQLDISSTGKKADLQERIKEHLKSAKKYAKQAKKYKVIDKKIKKRHAQIVEELQKKKVDELKEMLSKNNVKKAGNKAEIIERIADCMLHGVYPKCPQCHGGTLSVVYEKKFGSHAGQGRWSCKGFMDDDRFHNCAYRTTDEMDRPKWRDC